MARLAPAVVLAITVSGLGLVALGAEFNVASILTLGAAILVLSRFSTAEFHLVSLMWNLADVFTGGSVTRWYVKRHWRFFRRPKLGDRTKRIAWVMISRIAVCSDDMEKESEALTEFSVKASENPDHSWAAVKAYWREGHQAKDYWRNVQTHNK